ncbi:glucose dehydrogenase [FAD, quinone]-like isoform X2 [Leptidea sinapis]|uniref:glucose dehydrogenase [FAD, quinone]-like isoform X2 n=1 Tax=Leptidea sinapis TaxID=189913 RepID=UPI0021C2F272|nr:glucose dehydrogenase [FAD, quinone]-like isoform X2 [Leptidea sinapis]
MYLSLLMQLFGNSSENSVGRINPFQPPIKPTNDEDLTKDNEELMEFDFVIVGGGSAGCVIANRLSEVKNWKILLIEAGPEEPDITMVPSTVKTLAGSNIDWKYSTQPDNYTCQSQKGHVCGMPRGKTLGGSSAINYMVYMRGNKLDYDGWAAAGNPGWSYDEVLPYFKKSENNREATNTKLHGISGPLSVVKFPYIDNTTEIIVESFKEKGLPLIDLTSPNNLGVNIAYSTSENGKRQSANAAFIKPIRQLRSNLQILTDAFATKILIDPTSKTAFGIKYQKNGIFFKAIAKKEVIISSVKEDMDRIIEGMKFAVGLEETIAFKSAGISFDRTKLKGCQGMSWGSYDYFACLLMHYTTTIGHPVGTCKMGPKADKDAVVDAKLRVHGIKNLRVIDASVMPKITRGNTNAPTIMIAEKGSDMIKNDHEKSK